MVDKGMAMIAGVGGSIEGSNRGMSSGTDPKHAAGMGLDSDSDPDPDPDSGRAAIALAYHQFEPRAYLRNNYAPPRGDLSSPDGVGPWKLRCMAQTFATGEHGKGRERRERESVGTRRGPRSTTMGVYRGKQERVSRVPWCWPGVPATSDAEAGGPA